MAIFARKEAMGSEQERIKISPLIQIIYIIFSFSLVAYAISLRLQHPEIVGTIQPIEPVTPKKISAYGGLPDTINVGLHINSFSEFDVINNDFIFSGILWFDLYPQTASLKELRNFTIEGGRFTYISSPTVQMSDKRMLVYYDIEGKTSSPLNYAYFPMDTHRLYFVILHRGIRPQEAIFRASRRNFIFKPELISFGWRGVNMLAQSGIREAQLDTYNQEERREYPAALFSIDINRSSTRYMSSILLPLLFLVYLTTFTFSISFYGAMRMSVGAITAILAYRFVIENMSPSPGYFMLSDYFFFAALMATFFVFFANVIDQHVYRLPETAKHLATLGLHAIIVGMAVSIVFI